jgi:hypothetical protein
MWKILWTFFLLSNENYIDNGISYIKKTVVKKSYKKIKYILQTKGRQGGVWFGRWKKTFQFEESKRENIFGNFALVACTSFIVNPSYSPVLRNYRSSVNFEWTCLTIYKYNKGYYFFIHFELLNITQLPWCNFRDQ